MNQEEIKVKALQVLAGRSVVNAKIYCIENMGLCVNPEQKKFWKAVLEHIKSIS